MWGSAELNEVKGERQVGAASFGHPVTELRFRTAGLSQVQSKGTGFSNYISLTIFNLVLFGGLSLANAIWLQYSTVKVGSGLWLDGLTTTAFLVFFWVVLGALRYQTGRIELKVGNTLREIAGRLQALALALAAIVLFSAMLLLYSYLATATDRPLMDSYLASADAALGFDWVAYTQWLNKHPPIPAVISMAYGSLQIQMLVLPAILAFKGRMDRLLEFVACFGLSGILTCVVMTYAPAAGAFDFFHASPNILAAFGPGASTRHLDQLHALRELRSFLIEQPEGLVTFPSFHSALAAIFVFSMRGIRFAMLPAIVVNALLILATPPQGSHYLIDVIAGVAIAMMSAWMVSRVAGLSTHLTGTILLIRSRLRWI
ncbi:phosphatase PAP2 family protein [Mesorhizobium sp. WSM4898]|uniref:phosphatase PAP2 family protein n=1 Tax=Mesorhizobium sp. WSM4898 TaxID=3038544 RepID=UPI0024155B67|nr:phosphatase PAP2 family protein [Mesorhizobium sp. WSM4898]MDG4906115.1 phosphatase PAP2 family protein [Mesorhizobium sp. WSM4898]